MLIFIALLYFCAVCGVLGLLVFPSARSGVRQRLVFLRHQLGGLSRLEHAGARSAGELGRRIRELTHVSIRYVRRHWALFAILVPVVAIPSLLAVVLRRPGMVPGYDAAQPLPDAQVTALLKGEQLVPPVT